MELDDDGSPLEGDGALRAAEAEVVGGDVKITQALCEMHLRVPKAPSDEAAKELQEQKALSED